MLKWYNIIIELGSKVFVQFVKFFEVKAGGSAKAAGPDDARDHNWDVECLGDLGLLDERAELANNKEWPYERDEEQEAETEKWKYC